MKSILGVFFQCIIILNLCSCQNNVNKNTDEDILEQEISFYYGADLSYVNEMIDCGAVYKNNNSKDKDVYKIFSDSGCNLVRVRLWHNPTWTNYSNLADVKKTISKAKSLGMKVLLDFHYSDTWADPHKQLIPKAWENQIDNTSALGELLYNYTLETLNDLKVANLTPDIVQIGNEINPMILQGETLIWPIDWTRNAYLINKGIQAVRDFSNEVEVMLHIAQPENALPWFRDATINGINDYDWIGLSYYPLWSEYKLNDVSTPIKTLITTYNKRLMIVETAYPFTLQNLDSANNILDNNALINGYPASEQGQLDYLNTLKLKIEEAGGEGLIYWEPAWVSTSCSTLWGQGSHWDNATLFNHDNKPTLGMKFYNGSKN